MKSITVIGVDLGDKSHCWCGLNNGGSVVQRGRVRNTREKLSEFFKPLQRCMVVMEAGTHSPWISELMFELGHEVVVANPRRTRAIWDNVRKSDANDAEMLARLGRADIKLLHPIKHRSSACRADLAMIRSREVLVRHRSSLISHARGQVKSFGYRLPPCTTPAFVNCVKASIPEQLRPVLKPVLETISLLTEQIRYYDQQVKRLGRERYPEAMLLGSVIGVGPLTSLTYVLTIETIDKFDRGRSVAAYLGLVPRRDQSGQVDKKLPISKSGDELLRRLLVNCATYIMGPFARDSALRDWGLDLAERGGGRGKRRATVAVARKLAVILYAMWRDKSLYQRYPEQLAA